MKKIAVKNNWGKKVKRFIKKTKQTKKQTFWGLFTEEGKGSGKIKLKKMTITTNTHGRTKDRRKRGLGVGG